MSPPKTYAPRLFPEPKPERAHEADRQRARVITSMRPLRHALATIAAERSFPHNSDAKTVVLVGCGKAKGAELAPARFLYRSSLFVKSVELAELITGESMPRSSRVFVVSAAHGLLGIDEPVMPYDAELRTLDKEARATWARGVLHDLRARAPGTKLRVVLLMGATYADPLLEALGKLRESSTGWVEPADLLRGLEIGDRLWYLNHAIKLARALESS